MIFQVANFYCFHNGYILPFTSPMSIPYIKIVKKILSPHLYYYMYYKCSVKWGVDILSVNRIIINMRRIQIYNATHLVEWEDTPEAVKEAKMFRFCHPTFKYKRIKHVLRLDPDTIPVRRIMNRFTGKDSVNDGNYRG